MYICTHTSFLHTQNIWVNVFMRLFFKWRGSLQLNHRRSLLVYLVWEALFNSFLHTPVMMRPVCLIQNLFPFISTQPDSIHYPREITQAQESAESAAHTLSDIPNQSFLLPVSLSFSLSVKQCNLGLSSILVQSFHFP